MTTNEWDDAAPDWDANADVKNYAEKAQASWAEHVAPRMPDLAQSRVLDFGSGTGLLTMKLAAHCGQVIAIDSSTKMIEVLDTKLAESSTNNIQTAAVMLDRQTASEHPLLSEKFELIVASSVCSFLPDYGATLQVLSSLLDPGGYFVQWDWSSDMPATKIAAAFAAAGLAEQRIEIAFSMSFGEDSADVIMGVGRRPLQ